VPRTLSTVCVQDTLKYPALEKENLPRKTVGSSRTKVSENYEETAYMYALKVMEREKLCYLDDPKLAPSIARNNSKYWEILSNEGLKDLIYRQITENNKHEKDNIDAYCKNISDYIRRELRKKYYFGENFSENDFYKIENHAVFQNCVYDAQTGKKYPFNTKLPYYFAINADYMEEDEETPYYDKLKYDATEGDEESMKMIDLMIAYLLIPNRSAKCFFVMANARDSGKSMLGQFISRMYEGSPTRSFNPEHFENRFVFSGINEVVLLTCLEMSTDRLKKDAVAQFKRVTGDKYVHSEGKHKNGNDAIVRFKMLLATNGGIILPQGMEDPAFYRRVIVIPFVKSTPLDSLINDFDRKLWTERHAIASKCIRKLKKYIDKDGGIVFPESTLSISMKEKWIGGRYLDNEFIEQAFTYTGNTDDRVAIIDVENVYHFFIDTQKQLGSDILITDRKTLTNKILTWYVGTDKKKARVCLLKKKYEKEATNAIRRIAWNEEFLLSIGYPFERTDW